MNDEQRNLDLMKYCGNYNMWQASKLRPFVKGTTLEVGSGVGSITKFFYNEDFWGLDVNSDYVLECNKTFGKHFRVGDITSTSYWKSNFFDTVLMVNVLEHVEDDVVALDNVNVMLKNEGLLVGLYPAHSFLWSGVDVADGHFRRYSKRDLKQKFRSCGFEIIKFESFNFVGFFGWLWHKWRNLSVHSKNDLGMFDKIVPLIKFFDKFVPFGLSYFVVAKKSAFWSYEGKLWSQKELIEEINNIKLLKRNQIIMDWLPKNKLVLDLGCGIGSLTQSVACESKKVIGMDLIYNNIRIAEKFCYHPRIKYKVGNVNNAKGKYDVIIMSEVIEHLLKPYEMLQKCHKMLTKQGRLILTTPNATSLTNVLINVLKGNKSLGNVPGTQSEHVMSWDIRTLTRLLKEAKFEVLRYKTTKHSLVVEAKKC